MMKLPRIDATTFAQSFILRRATRKVQELVEALGEDNLAYLVENNKDLGTFLPAEQEAVFRQMAPSFGFVSAAISDEAFTAMLPSWAQRMVLANDQTKEWWRRQIEWIRGFFRGHTNPSQVPHPGAG